MKKEKGSKNTATLKPEGLHSTNWMLLMVFIFWMAVFTSWLTTSPLYSKQQAMYFPELKLIKENCNGVLQV